MRIVQDAQAKTAGGAAAGGAAALLVHCATLGARATTDNPASVAARVLFTVVATTAACSTVAVEITTHCYNCSVHGPFQRILSGLALAWQFRVVVVHSRSSDLVGRHICRGRRPKQRRSAFLVSFLLVSCHVTMTMAPQRLCLCQKLPTYGGARWSSS